MRIFLEWCEERSIETPLICVKTNSTVTSHEVVKKDGDIPYPPNSLDQIVVSIQRFLGENITFNFNFN